ncbi:MAG: TRAP transporter small permease [Aestuariivita sp.]|nr:TRAP transporter small permease [Aestuariivita sp.]MCY4203059.1 TRAP transporter small permease [Aestuariivita sp.]MCY4289345.1 TRAP transporter small permease [Aestuariivita sp.]MCY4347772.1 TRAP transporter small permease [Aestuariivita sp.]
MNVGEDPNDRHWSDQIEETLIACLLGAMTLVTFANVVARYLNSNILWALEASVFMFGWLVLLGASYAVKKRIHLGVDALINVLKPANRRLLGLLAVASCLVFAILLLKGAYDYWAVFADLPPTAGRWFPLGFEDSFRSQSFYEVDDIPMLPFLHFLEDWLNYGEEYEKLPKVLPYIVLPLSMLLLLYRFLQAAWDIWTGKSDRLVASHELEGEIHEVQ